MVSNPSRASVGRKMERSKGTDFANECRMRDLGCCRGLGTLRTSL